MKLKALKELLARTGLQARLEELTGEPLVMAGELENQPRNAGLDLLAIPEKFLPHMLKLRADLTARRWRAQREREEREEGDESIDRRIEKS